LAQLGFPLEEDKETLLTRTDTSDKGARRTELSKEYRILLLIGDNNGDFASGFTKGTLQDRDSLVIEYKDYWGKKWIALPNPVYGDWEGAIIDYNYSLADQEKLNLKYKALKW